MLTEGETIRMMMQNNSLDGAKRIRACKWPAKLYTMQFCDIAQYMCYIDPESHAPCRAFIGCHWHTNGDRNPQDQDVQTVHTNYEVCVFANRVLATSKYHGFIKVC